MGVLEREGDRRNASRPALGVLGAPRRAVTTKRGGFVHSQAYDCRGRDVCQWSVNKQPTFTHERKARRPRERGEIG